MTKVVLYGFAMIGVICLIPIILQSAVVIMAVIGAIATARMLVRHSLNRSTDLIDVTPRDPANRLDSYPD